MRKPLIAIVALVAAGGGLYWWHHGSTEQSLRRACVEVLSDRLRSPSSLKIMKWGSLTERPATKDEVVGAPPTKAEYGSAYESMLKTHNLLEESFQRNPGYMAEITIDYDAQNGFGTPIRDRSICGYRIYEQNARVRAAPPFTKVDGQTALQWSIDQIRR